MLNVRLTSAKVLHHRCPKYEANQQTESYQEKGNRQDLTVLVLVCLKLQATAFVVAQQSHVASALCLLQGVTKQLVSPGLPLWSDSPEASPGSQRGEVQTGRSPSGEIRQEEGVG